jgi:hypothetical protein
MTRGSYQSRSAVLRKDADEALEVLIDWCKKQNVSPCDFLFFALKKNIAKEAPKLEDSVSVLFKKFLTVGEDEPKNIITPLMGLALKIDTDLSKRQYEKLKSSNVFGKLPGLKNVRKAANELDPGNVTFQVVSKVTGEVLAEHEAGVGGGRMDVDEDLGHMTFGYLNINVHGFRATLCDTATKMFEDRYEDIYQGL